jgi:DNA (cytosine-5)-methyltransferase 1
VIHGLDLFSGIGGMSLGLHEFVRTVCYVESDPYCQALLANRIRDGYLPTAPIWSDVRTFDGGPWRGLVDIILAGFPCQDISAAGHGAGLAGERSGLFSEVLRIADGCQPALLFLENVPAIRTRGLSAVGTELAKRGYDCRWTIVSAQDVGAPHLRRRWFCLAAHADRLELRNESKRVSGRRQARLQRPRQTFTLNNGTQGTLADAACARLAQREGERGNKVEELQAALGADWWAVEPAVGRVADGVPHRVDQLRALGNAVVPRQARTAFEHLIGATLVSLKTEGAA